MDQQQRHTVDVSGDDLNRENGNGLPAQWEDIPANNSDSNFEDDASQGNAHINSSQDANTDHTMPMEVEVYEDDSLETINIITQHLLHVFSVAGNEDNLETTQSYTKDAKVRRRITDKWICMFQITDLELQSEGEAETLEITDTSEIAKIDKHLMGFFQAYNENIRDMINHNYQVIQALGSQYIYHAKNEVLKGVLVVVGNVPVENLRLNSHLLLEKSGPSSPLLYGNYHNVHIGHAYPIHTQDVVCTGGNSLRDLLRNWVDEKFYQRLHWIIPSTSPKMRLMLPRDTKAKEETDLHKYVNLIKKMEEAVLNDPRKSLDEPRTPLKKSQMTQSNSLYEYGNIEPGKEYSVRSHHWEVIEVPCNADNTVNDRAQRMVLAIKQSGGVIRKISQ